MIPYTLVTAAERLNYISNKLQSPVADLEVELKSLHLGIEAWAGVNSKLYPTAEIGYAKANDTWGIKLRALLGGSVWDFSHAPRQLRIDAIPMLPFLVLAIEAAVRKAIADIEAALLVVKGDTE